MLDIPIVFEVVPVDVNALVGLDVLDAHQLFADTVHNKLVHATGDRNVDSKTRYI